MKILAIDVGFAATGLAVLERDVNNKWTCIDLLCLETEAANVKQRARKSDDDIKRVLELSHGIGNMIDYHSLTRAVVEQPHGGARNGRAMRCMALASAAVATLLDTKGLAVENFSPNDTRMAAVGRTSKVSKEEVIAAMVKKHPRLAQCPNEHLADALATFEAAALYGTLTKL